MIPQRFYGSLSMAMALALISLGCGSDGPELGGVSGIVTLDGLPVPDGVLNTVIENAFAAGASVVGVDIYRDVAVAPGTDELYRTFQENENVVAATKHPSETGEGVPPPSVADANRVGFTDMVLDADGFVRRGLLSIGADDGGQTSLSLQTARLKLKQSGTTPEPAEGGGQHLRLGASVIRPLRENFGGFHSIDAAGYQFLLDYRRAPWQIQVVPSRDVFDPNIAADALSGKIVLIGVTSQQVKDHFILPIEGGAGRRATYGVVLHALAADQILRMAAGSNAPTRSLDAWVERLLVVLAAGCVVMLIARRKRPLAYIVAGVGGAVVCVVAGYVGLLFDWWLPSVPLAAFSHSDSVGRS